MKKKINWSVVSFYGLAVIFVVYGAFMISEVHTMLQQYGNVITFKEQMQYYVANCSAYFAYSLIFYGIASILNQLSKKQRESIEVEKEECVIEKQVLPRKYPKHRM